eukprot:evm.model.scf_3073.3 EVM.evm.TU.scf_3073.3   scf_3073:9662-10459(-)
MPARNGRQEEDWSSGLFACFDDAGLCIWGLLFPACLYADNVAFISKRQKQGAPQSAGTGWCCPCLTYCLCFYCSCCIAGLYRNDLRRKYRLMQEPCGDCTVHLCCSPCGLCQEAREIKVSGRGRPPGPL